MKICLLRRNIPDWENNCKKTEQAVTFFRVAACFLWNGNRSLYKRSLHFFIAVGIKVISGNKFLGGTLPEFFENMVKMCDIFKAALI